MIAFAGDGCFLMYPQELGTAAQHDAALIIIVVNNGTYGTIRMHQERRFPGRVIGTTAHRKLIGAPPILMTSRHSHDRKLRRRKANCPEQNNEPA